MGGFQWSPIMFTPSLQNLFLGPLNLELSFHGPVEVNLCVYSQYFVIHIVCISLSVIFCAISVVLIYITGRSFTTQAPRGSGTMVWKFVRYLVI